MHFWSKGVPLKPYWLILLVLLTYAATTCFAQNLNATEQQSHQYPDSVYRVIKARLDQAVRQQDKLAEGIHLQDIGLLFYHQGNYAQAIDFLLQAQKIFLAKKDANRLARNRNELGTVYYYNEQVEQALAQFNEALTFYQQQHNASGLAQTYANIGHIYEKRQSPNLAYRYQKLALANSRIAHDTVSLIKIYENLGSIFEDEARYDSAHYYYQNALTLAQQTRDEISQLEILNNLGDVFRKTGKYEQGLAYSRKALRMSQEKGELYQISAALRDIAKTYRLLNQPDSAYTYIERSRDLTDEIYGIENNRQITLLQTLYEVERKDSEIEQLNAQKRTDLVIIVATVVVLVLIGILGAVIIRQQRLKLQNQRERIEVELKNRQLEEENLKSQLELKSKELTAHTLQIIQKNQVLEELKNDLTAILKDDKRDQKKLLRQLAQKIDLSFNQDKYWDDFRTIFDQVHPNFFHSLTQQFPDLTATDLRLIALLKMNINSTDVATLLGISPDSLRVARYRLRKKISLAEGESLSTFIQRFPSPIQPSSEKI